MPAVVTCSSHCCICLGHLGQHNTDSIISFGQGVSCSAVADTFAYKLCQCTQALSMIIIYNLRSRVKLMVLKLKYQPQQHTAFTVVFALATLSSTRQIGLFQLAKECRVSLLLTFLGTNFANVDKP